MDAETVLHLLQTATAVHNRHYSNLQALLQLPAAAQLSSHQILDLMKRATSSDLVQHHAFHLQAPAAAYGSSIVEPSSMGKLERQLQRLNCSSITTSTAGLSTGSCLSVLCQCEGAAAIGPAGR
jgi:hypothetical protein